MVCIGEEEAEVVGEFDLLFLFLALALAFAFSFSFSSSSSFRFGVEIEMIYTYLPTYLPIGVPRPGGMHYILSYLPSYHLPTYYLPTYHN